MPSLTDALADLQRIQLRCYPDGAIDYVARVDGSGNVIQMISKTRRDALAAVVAGIAAEYPDLVRDAAFASIPDDEEEPVDDDTDLVDELAKLLGSIRRFLTVPKL